MRYIISLCSSFRAPWDYFSSQILRSFWLFFRMRIRWFVFRLIFNSTYISHGRIARTLSTPQLWVDIRFQRHMSIRGIRPCHWRPFSSGFPRLAVDNCFTNSPVTANYPQLSSTDEPSTAILHTYYAYFSLVVYSWRRPFMAAPAIIYGCPGTCLDTYTIHNRIHACTHDQLTIVHTCYSTVSTVQLHLPHICIYCI